LQLGKSGRNSTVIAAAEILQENWYKGVVLDQVRQGEPVIGEKVEQLRVAISNKLGLQFYSFTTKVFHLLNSQYPILDSNVKQFMRERGFSRRKNFSSKKRSYQEFYAAFVKMIEALSWEKNEVEKLDIAIWEFITQQKTRNKVKVDKT
jgi:hypothetical protein